MARASITTKSGATVMIEGTQDEVAALLARLEGGAVPDGGPRARPAARRLNGTRPTPMGLLSELIAEAFFAEPRELAAVRIALREKGHFYPVTTLSPIMLRLVRKKELRRIKDSGRWTYVR